MSITENLLHFSETKENIPRHKHSNFLYLFKTKPDDEDGKSFVKIGITEKQTLLGRLDDYKPYVNIALTIYPSQINYIHTQDVRLRETLLKRILNKHPEIEVYHNAEYFKGPYDLLLKIFTLIGLKEIDYLSRYADVEKSLILLNSILELQDPLTEESCNSKSLSCSKCGRECKDRKGLTLHESKCEEVNNLNCSFCNTIFQSRSSVIRHEKTCNFIKEEIKRKEQEEKDEKHKNEIKDIRETYEQQLITLRESYEVQVRDMKNLYDQKVVEVNNLRNRCPDDISNNPQYINTIKNLDITKRDLNSKIIDCIELVKKKDKLQEMYNHLLEEFIELSRDYTTLTKEATKDKNKIIQLLEYRQ